MGHLRSIVHSQPGLPQHLANLFRHRLAQRGVTGLIDVDAVRIGTAGVIAGIEKGDAAVGGDLSVSGGQLA